MSQDQPSLSAPSSTNREPGTAYKLTAPAGCPRVVVIHQAPTTSPNDLRQSTPSPTHRPLLGRLGPTDSGLQLLVDDLTWLSRTLPTLRRLPVTYQVRLARQPDPALVSRLQRGVTDYGEFLAATEVKILTSAAARDWLEVTINHGKTTTVRRLMGAFGLKVLEVVRTRVGPVSIGTLRSNEQRVLTREELASLTKDPRG